MFIAAYALIYSFLTTHSHEKAAEAVKKAAKSVVVLKEDVKPETSLEEILKWWKKKKEADAYVNLLCDVFSCSFLSV